MAARKPRTAAKTTAAAVDVTGRPIWPAGIELKSTPAQEPPSSTSSENTPEGDD